MVQTLSPSPPSAHQMPWWHPDDDGVQIIDITNPYQPTAVSNVTDGSDGYSHLDYARSITTATINSSTYALVASSLDHGVQIINITDPYKPIPASNVTNDLDGFTTLASPNYITTITTGSLTYALVTAFGDNAVQIINITNPYQPTAASSIIDGSDGFTTLAGVRSITTIVDSSTYALAAARTDDGIQIMRINLPPALVSNNPNPVHAKAGDTLTLEFAINDTIVSSTTQFTNPDQIPSMTIYNATYIATLTVPSDPIEAYADFKVTLENNHTIKLSVTENDLSSNVFVDTIAPTIELEGDADYTVYIGDHDYTIPGATASDGSSGYSSSDYGTTIDGTLDPGIIGSTVTYSYTAHPDAAGNLGQVVNRTVTVVDYTPLNVISLTVTSNNPVNSIYAKAGDEIEITLKTDGNRTNAINFITGAESFDEEIYSNPQGNTVFLEKIITQSDTNGNLTFDILVATSLGYAARVTQNNLTTSNIIIDTVPPLLYLYGANNTISAIGSSYVDPGAISYDLSYGIKDVTSTDSVITSQVGTYHIEYDAPDFAGNPANIIRTVHVQKLPQLSLTSESSNLLITPESPIADPIQYPHLTDPFHIETVQIDGSTYALVASNRDSGFTILNMDNPELPSLVFNATSTQANYSAIQGILGASPIQIQGKTYVVTISSSSKILIADITNPASPTVVSERSNGPNYPYLTNMTAISTFSIGDAAYAMIASQSGSWVSILNITEPANPTHLTVLENGANYDLNGPRHIAIIDADGSTFAVITSRTTGTVTILNMDNPEMPVQIHAIKDGIGLALSSATGIELVEINTRTYALVASNLDNAMQIIDITHPQLPFCSLNCTKKRH